MFVWFVIILFLVFGFGLQAYNILFALFSGVFGVVLRLILLLREVWPITRDFCEFSVFVFGCFAVCWCLCTLWWVLAAAVLCVLCAL